MLLSIRDEELLNTIKAHGIEFPEGDKAVLIEKIRAQMLSMPLGNALSLVWKEYLDSKK